MSTFGGRSRKRGRVSSSSLGGILDDRVFKRKVRKIVNEEVKDIDNSSVKTGYLYASSADIKDLSVDGAEITSLISDTVDEAITNSNENLSTSDAVILLDSENIVDDKTSGFVSKTGSNYAGLLRDGTSKEYYLVQNTVAEPDETTNAAELARGTINANIKTSSIDGSASNVNISIGDPADTGSIISNRELQILNDLKVTGDAIDLTVSNTDNSNLVSDCQIRQFSTGLCNGGNALEYESISTIAINGGTGAFQENDLIEGADTICIQWNKITNFLINTALGDITYVGMTRGVGDNPTPVFQNTPYTDTQKKTTIPLGYVLHPGGGDIKVVISKPMLATYPNQHVETIASEVIGIMNLEGNTISSPGANLRLSKTAGKIYSKGAGSSTLAPDVVVTTQINTDATGRITYYDANGNIQYTNLQDIKLEWMDNGVVSATENKRWYAQPVFQVIGDPNNLYMMLSQEEYKNQEDAEAGISDFIIAGYLTEVACLIGHVIHKGNVTDLSDENKAMLVQVGKFGSTMGAVASSVSFPLEAADDSFQYTFANALTSGMKRDSLTGDVILARNGAELLKLTTNAGTDVVEVTDLVVSGTETIINTTAIDVEDPIIDLATSNTLNNLNTGLTIQTGNTSWSGLIRGTNDNFHLFTDPSTKPSESTVATDPSQLDTTGLRVNSIQVSNNDTNHNYTEFKVASTGHVNQTYTEPTNYPTSNGQLLSSTTGGVKTWIDPPSSAQVQIDLTNTTLQPFFSVETKRWNGAAYVTATSLATTSFASNSTYIFMGTEDSVGGSAFRGYVQMYDKNFNLLSTIRVGKQGTNNAGTGVVKIKVYGDVILAAMDRRNYGGPGALDLHVIQIVNDELIEIGSTVDNGFQYHNGVVANGYMYTMSGVQLHTLAINLEAPSLTLVSQTNFSAQLTGGASTQSLRDMVKLDGDRLAYSRRVSSTEQYIDFFDISDAETPTHIASHELEQYHDNAALTTNNLFYFNRFLWFATFTGDIFRIDVNDVTTMTLNDVTRLTGSVTGQPATFAVWGDYVIHAAGNGISLGLHIYPSDFEGDPLNNNTYNDPPLVDIADVGTVFGMTVIDNNIYMGDQKNNARVNHVTIDDNIRAPIVNASSVVSQNMKAQLINTNDINTDRVLSGSVSATRMDASKIIIKGSTPGSILYIDDENKIAAVQPDGIAFQAGGDASILGAPVKTFATPTGTIDRNLFVDYGTLFSTPIISFTPTDLDVTVNGIEYKGTTPATFELYYTISGYSINTNAWTLWRKNGSIVPGTRCYDNYNGVDRPRCFTGKTYVTVSNGDVLDVAVRSQGGANGTFNIYNLNIGMRKVPF